jgi:hypothetical protein
VAAKAFALPSFSVQEIVELHRPTVDARYERRRAFPLTMR